MKAKAQKKIAKSTFYTWCKQKSIRPFKIFLLFIPFTCCLTAKDKKFIFQKPERMAILGDGFSQGEAATPNLDFKAGSLLKILKGEAEKKAQDPLKPRLTWPSYKSFSNPLSWIVKHLLAAFNRLSLNNSELSWGALVASKLGVPLPKVTIAAQRHSPVSAITNQYEQTINLNPESYVDTYFIALAGADLCQQDPSLIPSSETIEKKLTQLLNYMIRRDGSLKQKYRTLQVVLLNYVGITQILTADEIKNKMIQLSEKKSVSCQTFLKTRQGFPYSQSTDPNEKFVQTLFPLNSQITCPTLFSLSSFTEANTSFFSFLNKEEKRREVMLSQEKQISYLANLISNYRDKMKQVIEKLKEKALNKGVQLFFIDEVENISFKAEDIANNCTNLNGNAQKKVADQVLQSLNKS